MNNGIIKTIKIEIAGVEVEITPQQAKDLHQALGDLLGVKAEFGKEYVYTPYWNPAWPYKNTWLKVTPAGTFETGDNKWTAHYDINTCSVDLSIK